MKYNGTNLDSRPSDRARRGRLSACLLSVAGACCLLFSVSSPLEASPDVPREYRIKAAYLHKFLLFVKWPDAVRTQPQKAFIAVVGDSPFDDAFDEVVGQPVGPDGARLTVVNYATVGELVDAAPAARYHLVFVAKAHRAHVPELLAALKDRPIVTVADHEGFLEAGGMINLVLHKNTVRWEINRDAFAKADLGVHSQLLRNAVRVVP